MCWESGADIMYTIEFLRSRRVWFEPLLHRPASSSTQRAKSMHVPGRCVAKTVLIKAGDEFVMVVVASTSQVDLSKLSDLLRVPASDVRLAQLDELVGIFTDCEPGVVPSFGRLYNLATVCDASLAELDELFFAGNTRHEGLRMRSRDYLAIEEPMMGVIGAPIAAQPPISALSRADRRAG
jgi:Ala-tRNA(Pro) deacylase